MIAPTDGKGETSGVGADALLKDPHRLRGDCRLILQMLSLGVFTIDETKQHIRAARPMLRKAIKEGSARNYAAVMKMLAELARVEQTAKPQQLNVDVSGDLTITGEQSRLSAITSEFRSEGLLDDLDAEAAENGAGGNGASGNGEGPHGD